MPGTRKRPPQQVLAELYDRSGGDLYRYLTIVLSSTNRAEDVLQEVFLRLLRVARRDPEALANRFYVLRVARNEAFRQMGRRRHRAIEQNDGLLTIRDPRHGSESERIAIAEALARLPEEQREVLHLKIYMSMTFAEIAEVTQTPQNTVASRYRYALEKLRRLLGNEEESP